MSVPSGDRRAAGRKCGRAGSAIMSANGSRRRRAPTVPSRPGLGERPGIALGHQAEELDFG